MTYEITLNAQYNSTEITFTEKPAESIREVLKSFGFRWNGKRGLWYGFKDAETVKKALESIATEEVITEAHKAINKAYKAVESHTQNHIKFYYNGIRVDGGELIKCGYSVRDNGEISIFARNYDSLPRDIFEVKNDTDLYTDYFDEDSTDLQPDHPLYKYARYAALKAQAKDAERGIKYNKKEIERGEVWTGFIEYRKENIARYEKILEAFKGEADPGQPTAEDLEQIDKARQEAENERRRQEHEAELAERERVLNRRASGRKFIEDIAELHPITENVPTVEIPFSEDPAFYSWTTSQDRTATTITVNSDGTTTKNTEIIEPKRNLVLSITAAELVLYHFDMIDVAGQGYFKTDFVIRYNDPETGEENTYSGRYDLGDRENGLIQHIRNHGEWFLTHDRFGHVKEQPEETNEIVQFADYLAQFTA